ncbi:hypothetical protein [Hyphomicrobium sp. 2TAF46]|uniref:hypothetical protein n=1 Tax=Hyphomicrobium sp. 2TAF46 TaxID=3233019 RepID=UPI003F930CAE
MAGTRSLARAILDFGGEHVLTKDFHEDYLLVARLLTTPGEIKEEAMAFQASTTFFACGCISRQKERDRSPGRQSYDPNGMFRVLGNGKFNASQTDKLTEDLSRLRDNNRRAAPRN